MVGYHIQIASLKEFTVVAFHGQGGTPSVLRKDMQDPNWVSRYQKWHGLKETASLLEFENNLVLVGYSIGGARALQLAHLLSNVRALVLYETPMPKDTKASNPDQIDVDIPVQVIWNKRGRKHWRRCRSLQSALEQRTGTRSLTSTLYLKDGWHCRFAWDWPPIRHAWSSRANPTIEQFLAFVSVL